MPSIWPRSRTSAVCGVTVASARPTIVAIECLDDSNGIVDWHGADHFAVITKSYLAEGRARTGLVGSAESELIDASDLIAYGVAWMEEHFG